MDSAEVRSLLAATLEEITDETGNVVGVVRAPARFRAGRSYLSNGGFLVVERDEVDNEFVGVEYDAFYDKKSQRHYPSGFSARVFKVRTLEEATALAEAYLSAPE